MKRKSSDKRVVTKNAKRIKRSTAEELSRLAAKMDDEVDTFDIPERTEPVVRIRRDANGRIVKPRESKIRIAILSELKRRGISGHQLWIEARKYCETITESAVYEFLAGKRQVGLAYLDAMMEAMDLTVTRRS